MRRFICFFLLAVLFVISGCGGNKEAIQQTIPMTEQTVYQLDGEWEMYPQRLLSPEEIGQYSPSIVPAPLSFQKLWGDANGYATFHKQITLDAQQVNENMAIYSQYMYTAYRLYIDGQLVLQGGQVGKTKQQSKPEMSAKIGYFTPKNKTLNIVLQISNFHHQQGGVNNDLVIGSPQDVTNYYHYQHYQLFFQIGILFIIGVFGILFALLAKKQYLFLVFGIFCFLMVLRGLFAGNIFIATICPSMSWLTITRIEYLITEWLSVVSVLMIYLLYRDRILKWMFFVILTTVCMLSVITLVTEVAVFQAYFMRVFLLVVPIFFYMLFLLIKQTLQKDFTAIWLMIGSFLMFITVINDYLVAQNLLSTGQLAMYGATIFGVCQVIATSHSYAKELQRTKYLNNELQILNHSLDAKVKKSMQDILEMNKRLQQQAWKDGLTQVYNRQYFNDQCEGVFPEGTNMGLILMDIDEYKAYNDCYGHVAGDAILYTFAQTALQQVPPNGFLARYGGEEFAILLTSTTKAQCFEVGEAVRQAIEKMNIEHKMAENKIITISAGIVFAQNLSDYAKITDFIDAADQALYKAKAEGRNQVVIKQ
ncbi:sensor domain-containing diguanylate cyclase [Bacillus ndiopicus]|uniref:sensor domain-containing diguanylate cyclase n=1 Tax=Bacillus ndiopicus TaxID=1347368 RepID=UPI0005AA5DD4|nr:diguanylate cyclase [Bacillus ndiopicus]